MDLENSPHPAQRAAALSARYASERRKAEWLALYADDAIVEDPVGVSPLDPTGHGHRGRKGLEAFWDMAIGPGNMTYQIHQSTACGDECANVWSVSNRMPDGFLLTVDVISIYKVNASGKLMAMRAFWNFSDIEEKLKASLKA
jgi:hypothetical protein